MASSRIRIARGGMGAVLASVLAACGGGGGGGMGTGIPSDLATVAGSPEVAARTQHAGAFAADYVRGAHFTSIEIEVDYPQGRVPSQAVLDVLRERLAERCTKPAGVVIRLDDAIPAEEYPAHLGEGDLERIEDAYRQTYSETKSETAAMYVLFVSGRMAPEVYGGEVLGLAYRAGSLAVFVDSADQGSNMFVTTEEMEAAALVHECGHLLGLVNNGVPMVVDHEDIDHPGHDVDPTCIMYWTVQLGRTGPNLGDANFAQFSEACKADLAAFGGR